MSVIFELNENEITVLLESCRRDESLPIIERHFPLGSLLLEAGCGLGRWVRFLLSRRPFAHSHMQTIVAVKSKPEESRVDGRGFETHSIRGVR